MKKIRLALPALLLFAVCTACRTGTHVVVSSDDNNTKIKLEYWGTVKLSSDQTVITSIAHNGFVDYKKNNDELRVTNGANEIFNYELNGRKVVALDAGGRALLAEAVQGIAKVQNGH